MWNGITVKQMISVDEALEIVQSRAWEPSVETVPLHCVLGRVLAQDVLADHDMPPFDKSAMDGYACRREDLGGALKVLETIAAGHLPQLAVAAGTCSRIMTGAIVPEGADCVFMVEQSEELPDGTVRFTGEKTADNIARQGEDIQKGRVLLAAGTRMEPRHVAVLAGAGCAEPRVAVRPKVGVLATGSELVSVDQPVSGASIRETNGPQLVAQIEACGAEAVYYGIIEDDPAAIEAAIERAVSENEVVLISGGSSVGDFDFVPDLIAKNGREILFEKVAIKPGKPLVFACSDTAACFGMPGNPVATYVVMELFVKPFLQRSMGCVAEPLVVTQKLAQAVRRKKGGRRAYVPVEFCGKGQVRAIRYHGSAHIHALSGADGFIAFPEESLELAEGAEVDVRLI